MDTNVLVLPTLAAPPTSHQLLRKDLGRATRSGLIMLESYALQAGTYLWPCHRSARCLTLDPLPTRLSIWFTASADMDLLSALWQDPCIQKWIKSIPFLHGSYFSAVLDVSRRFRCTYGAPSEEWNPNQARGWLRRVPSCQSLLSWF